MEPHRTNPTAMRVLGQATVPFGIGLALAPILAVDGFCGLAHTNGFDGARTCAAGRVGLSLAYVRLHVALRRVCRLFGRAWCSKGVLARWRPTVGEAMRSRLLFHYVFS